MKFTVALSSLTAAALMGCVYLPTAGPAAGAVIEQSVQQSQIRYDVVDVNANVVTTLLA